jgi:hypothetical protein
VDPGLAPDPMAAPYPLSFQDVLEALTPEDWFKLPFRCQKVLRVIAGCGKGGSGYDFFECGTCHHEVSLPRACQNRNCPMCGAARAMKWADDRCRELLPLYYRHVVVSPPWRVHELSMSNQAVIYDLLMSSVRQALLGIASGCQPHGFVPSVVLTLQTWSQGLDYFPHVHGLVSLGGYSEEQKALVALGKDDPVYQGRQILALVIPLFLEGLSALYAQKKLSFELAGEALASPEGWSALMKKLAAPEAWKSYSEAPWGGPAVTIRYLSRYVCRTAISNYRIVKLKNGLVTFSGLDSSRKKQIKRTLPVFTFIQLFCMHIPPKGFHRIRLAGLLSRRKLLELARAAPTIGPKLENPVMAARCFKPLPIICPACGQGHLEYKGNSYGRSREVNNAVEHCRPRAQAPPGDRAHA